MTAMTHIETVTVGSGGAASITFMSVGDIPSDYTDLVVLVSARSSHTSSFLVDELDLNLNGSATGFSCRRLYAREAGVASDTATTSLGQVVNNSATANTFGSTTLYIPNYRSSANKSYSVDYVTENNGTQAYRGIVAGLWSNTAAITSLTLDLGSGNFLEFSSASLYGITAGSDGIVTVS